MRAPRGRRDPSRTHTHTKGTLWTFILCGSQAVVAEELLSAHGARVLHVHQAVHTEGKEAAAQEASAASAAAGCGRGSPLREGAALRFSPGVPSGLAPAPSPPGLLGTLPIHAPWLPPQTLHDRCPAEAGGTHPKMKRPVHSIQVRTPGTGLVTVMM